MESARRAGSIASSTALRASSCRKPTPAAAAWRTPAARQSVQASRGLAEDLLQQAQFGVHADDCRGVEHLSAARLQARGAGEHGVTDARRDAHPAGCEHLGDEKGLPPVWRWSSVGSTSEPLGESCGRPPRERRQGDSSSRLDVAEDESQRVLAAELVVTVSRERARAVRSSRRPRKRSRSRVASSAQWTSSTDRDRRLEASAPDVATEDVSSRSIRGQRVGRSPPSWPARS